MRSTTLLRMARSDTSPEELQAVRTYSEPALPAISRGRPTQHVVTSVPSSSITSWIMTSNNSSKVSLASSTSQFPQLSTNMPPRSSPDMMAPISALSSSLPNYMALPDPILPPTSAPTSPPVMSPSAMAEAIAIT